MLNILEVNAKLDQVLATENAAEERVEASLQPVFTLPDPESGHVFEITPNYLQQQIGLLANQLIRDMQGKRVLLLGLMDGVRFFAGELLRAIKLENQSKNPQDQFKIEYTTVRTSSYEQTKSGNLTIDSLKVKVGRRIVVVLDDILDTGNTLAGVIKSLESKGAKEVYTMVLFDKVIEGRNLRNADYCGVRVSPDHFYVGAGMDYLTDYLRELPTLYAVDHSTLLTEEEKAIVSQKHALNTELEKIIAAAQPQKASGPLSQSIFTLHKSRDALPTTAIVDNNIPVTKVSSSDLRF